MLNLIVTLWPSFPHFANFAKDKRINGIRLNSAMISNPELDSELKTIQSVKTVPLYFDIKGRQLRVQEVHPNPDYLDITLNHPIFVETPTIVLFKAAADRALLERIEEGGRRLIFRGGPRYLVKEGESLHIRHPSLQTFGPQFTKVELEKIAKVKKAGMKRFFLSYVENQRDVDQFLELVGKDSDVWLKIENKKGLEYVATKFKKKDNLTLVAARGDLYVEIDRPHQILSALKLIIKKDPEACVGSRILLSIVHEPILENFNAVIRTRPTAIDYDKLLASVQVPGVPSCADWHELAYLYDIGYRNMMLCDELCLKEPLLATAVNAFESFRQEYDRDNLLNKIRKNLK